MDAIISLRAGVLRGTVVALQISAQLLPTTDCALPLSKIRAKYQEACMLAFGRTAKVGRKKSEKRTLMWKEALNFQSGYNFFFLLVKVVSEEKSSNRLQWLFCLIWPKF